MTSEREQTDTTFGPGVYDREQAVLSKYPQPSTTQVWMVTLRSHEDGLEQTIYVIHKNYWPAVRRAKEASSITNPKLYRRAIGTTLSALEPAEIADFEHDVAVFEPEAVD